MRRYDLFNDDMSELFWKEEFGEFPRQPLPVEDVFSLHEKPQILAGIDTTSEEAFEIFIDPVKANSEVGIGKEAVIISGVVRLIPDLPASENHIQTVAS